MRQSNTLAEWVNDFVTFETENSEYYFNRWQNGMMTDDLHLSRANVSLVIRNNSKQFTTASSRFGISLEIVSSSLLICHYVDHVWPISSSVRVEWQNSWAHFAQTFCGRRKYAWINKKCSAPWSLPPTMSTTMRKYRRKHLNVLLPKLLLLHSHSSNAKNSQSCV